VDSSCTAQVSKNTRCGEGTKGGFASVFGQRHAINIPNMKEIIAAEPRGEMVQKVVERQLVQWGTGGGRKKGTSGYHRKINNTLRGTSWD